MTITRKLLEVWNKQEKLSWHCWLSFYSKRNHDHDLTSFIVGLIIDENDRFYCAKGWPDLRPCQGRRSTPHTMLGTTVKGLLHGYEAKTPPDNLRSDTTQDQFGWGRVWSFMRLGCLCGYRPLRQGNVTCHSIFSLSLRNSGLRRATNSIRLEVDKKDRIWGLLGPSKRTFNVCRPAYNNMQNQNWPAHCMQIASCPGTLFTCQEITCLALSILASVAGATFGTSSRCVIGFSEVDRTWTSPSNHVLLKCWKMMPRWFWPI